MSARARESTPARQEVGDSDDDPRAAAAAARLRYIEGAEVGLSRRRCGRGFAYRDARGKPVSARTKQRIEALSIPPAWTNVWICRSANGHLQATGVDDRGRKQYLYHQRWRDYRDAATFERLAQTGVALLQVRDEVARQLRRRTLDETRLLAGMVHLLDITGIRVGNETYERSNGTIGLTTLRWRHLQLDSGVIRARFTAKSRVRTEFTIHDAPLHRLLESLVAGPRRRVFALEGRAFGAGDVNRYLAELAHHHLTAKDFRTWRGTVAALAYLRSLPAGSKPTKKQAVAAIDAAAAALRNTRAVARAHYVHPGLIAAYLAGDLEAAPASGGRSEEDSYVRAEQAMCALLRELPCAAQVVKAAG